MTGKTVKISEMKGKTINTISGEALYYCTEIEDKNEKWNDDYSTTQGFYVIHRGDKHHVYRVIGNRYTDIL